MFIRLCFGFWEIANPLGNLKHLGWLAVVFPWYMTCMGKNSPDKVTTKVRVMFLLSVRPLIGTDARNFLQPSPFSRRKHTSKEFDSHLTPTQEESCSLSSTCKYQ